MNNIQFFLKFGEREHLARLKQGNLFFSNAETFRSYEENLRIKGQGDHLEGGTMVAATNMTMIDNATGKRLFTDINCNLLVHYKPANLLPVFCVFSCFEKDCIVNADGVLSINLSDEIKRNIISHFPKADTVAIIKNPYQFIEDVVSTVGTTCKSDLVHYFHLDVSTSDSVKINDAAYHKYLTQDIPPRKENGKIIRSFNSKYIYRALLCKDKFFEQEQEYRFILPEINIDKAQEFPVQLREEIELQDLEHFFSNY